jgi:hypothetical protein
MPAVLRSVSRQTPHGQLGMERRQGRIDPQRLVFEDKYERSQLVGISPRVSVKSWSQPIETLSNFQGNANPHVLNGLPSRALGRAVAR